MPGPSSRAAGATAVALRSDRVVLPDAVVAATLLLRDGRVEAVAAYDAQVPAAYALHDVSGLVVSPGIVDSHVHINEPGRTEWEGFTTATKAAAAGGVTTLVDMPLNSVPPTTTVEALDLKRDAARGQAWVDVAFWGGITSTDTSSVAPLVAAGVCGFKVFLVESGVEEFCCVGVDGLHDALAAAAPLDVPVIVHAEAPGPLAAAPAPHGRAYADYLASRPPAAETEAVAAVIAAARATGGQAHVLHLSAAESLPLLTEARTAGVRITAETCPHYLSLAAEDIPDGATQTKCAPPVRGAANRDALWQALTAGQIDCIVSDHSPAPPSVKAMDTGDFAAAWGGIAGLQTSLPVVWTQARSRGHSVLDLARWQSQRPAQLAGLPGKGTITPGADADLVVWDPDATFVVEAAALQHRHAVSPWQGVTLHGVVHETWLRGAPVDISGPPAGALLRRGKRAT